jgi:hypothetical protein
MVDVTASRTLVKSHPELWTECSDAESLARHLDGFGEIRITRLEPETAVAWEGERASGTVRLEPSGWGTRVVLTATPAPAPEPAVAEPGPEAAPVPAAAALAPVPPAEPDLAPAEATVRPGLLARLLGRWRTRPSADLPPPEAPSPPAPPAAAEPGVPAEPEPVATPTPVPVATPTPVADADPGAAQPASVDPEAALAAALDSLGRAHHRPYSRG